MIGSGRAQQWLSALGEVIEPSSCSAWEARKLRIRGTDYVVEVPGRRPGSSLESCWQEFTREDRRNWSWMSMGTAAGTDTQHRKKRTTSPSWLLLFPVSSRSPAG